MIISFVGHANIPSNPKIKNILKNQLENNIKSDEPIICYLGGYGNFDDLCTRLCKELKETYNNIEIVYVSPYITSKQLKNQETQNLNYFDYSIYPPIENTPPKFAISKRNEWMIDKSDLVMAYVQHNFGGAYKSLLIAKRKKKKIINIYDLI